MSRHTKRSKVRKSRLTPRDQALLELVDTSLRMVPAFLRALEVASKAHPVRWVDDEDRKILAKLP